MNFKSSLFAILRKWNTKCILKMHANSNKSIMYEKILHQHKG